MKSDDATTARHRTATNGVHRRMTFGSASDTIRRRATKYGCWSTSTSTKYWVEWKAILSLANRRRNVWMTRDEQHRLERFGCVDWKRLMTNLWRRWKLQVGDVSVEGTVKFLDERVRLYGGADVIRNILTDCSCNGRCRCSCWNLLKHQPVDVSNARWHRSYKCYRRKTLSYLEGRPK